MKIERIVIFIALASSFVFAQDKGDPAAQVGALRNAIQQGRLSMAMFYSSWMISFADAQIEHTTMQTLAPFGNGIRAKNVPVEDSAKLLAMVDNIDLALTAGDMKKVIHSTSVLVGAIVQEERTLTPSSAERLSVSENMAANSNTASKRFLILPDMAKAAYDAGDLPKALDYANEILATAPNYPASLTGNAVHYGNIVAGRVALRSGGIVDASAHLLAAGKVSGSPNLNSFGPNMALASELLAQGERNVVLEYLTECKAFWKGDNGRLEQWASDIRSGKTPSFGTSLTH